MRATTRSRQQNYRLSRAGQTTEVDAVSVDVSATVQSA